MFGFMKRLMRKSSSLNSTFASQLFAVGGGNATWTQQNYANFVKQGYSKNVIVYHCVTNIAQAASNIPFILYVNDEEIEEDSDNPILKILKKPNSKQSYNKWIKELITYRLISGNAYVHSNIASARKSNFLMELTNFRPDRVKILESGGVPFAYEYSVNSKTYRYPIDPITGKSEILHDKEINPIDDLYGLSPMAAAAISIDQHNESSEWNKKLLENAGKLSGIVSIKNAGDAISLAESEKQRISDSINQKYAGFENPGRIFFSDVELDYKQLAISPTDMDWLNGKNTSARDICLAYKYPPILLGIPDSSTYNNMQEAKLALYEECIIPLLNDVFTSLSHYLSINLEQDIELQPDLDQVTALIPRREDARRSAREDVAAGIITVNEAREESRWETVPGGDELFLPAGKLPLSFDMPADSGVKKSEFKKWLKKEGFSQENVKSMVKIAYASEKRKDRNKSS